MIWWKTTVQGLSSFVSNEFAFIYGVLYSVSSSFTPKNMPTSNIYATKQK